MHWPRATWLIFINADVYNAIQQLKQGKSCGPDGIPSEAIKHSGHLLSVHVSFGKKLKDPLAAE
jgi:hypothetical protein